MPATPPPTPGAVPIAPDRSDRVNFSIRATAAFEYVKTTMWSDMVAFVANAYANALDAFASATSAANSASIATTQANYAIGAAGAEVWTSGEAFGAGPAHPCVGDARYSPLDGQSYRRKTVGSGGVDPSLDLTSTNWQRIATAQGVVPVNGMIAFDSGITANTVTDGYGATYLKTGVIADASTYPLAAKAPYLTSATKANSAAPYMATLVSGFNAPAGLHTGSSASNGTVTVAIGSSTNATTGASGATTTDGINWTAFRFPSFAAGGSHQGVAYGAGVFCVPIANTNTCYTSPDGVTWTLRTMASSGAWYAIAFGGGKFCATANGTTAVNHSTDGINWTSATNSRSPSSAGLLYGAGLFVSYDSGVASSQISTSPDAINWTNRTVPAPSDSWKNMATDGTNLVYARYDATNGYATSTDGIAWTVRAYQPNNGNPVYYLNGKFHRRAVAPGTSDCTSTNGAVWVTTTLTTVAGFSIPLACGVAGGLYWAFDSSNIWLSHDAQSWGHLGLAGMTCQQLGYGAGWYFAAFSTSGYELGYSKDGLTWFRCAAPIASNAYLGATYFNSLYIVMGGSGPYTSPDRMTWTVRTATNYGALFVANNRVFSVPTSAATAFSWSSDGTTWSNTAALPSAAWRGVVFGNSKYMTWSASLTTPYTSADGVTFTIATALPEGNVSQVVFFNGLFVAFSDTGKMYTSTDGTVWATTSIAYRDAFTNAHTCAAAVSTTLVAFDGTRRMAVSTDGATFYNRGLASNPQVGSTAAFVVNGTTLASASGNTAYTLTITTDKVLNDVALKTYHATVAAELTNFYKRVA